MYDKCHTNILYSAHVCKFEKANICNGAVFSGERVNNPIITTYHATHFSFINTYNAISLPVLAKV